VVDRRTRSYRERAPAALVDLISPLGVSWLIALVQVDKLTDCLARQVLDDVIEGEGHPSESVESCGPKVAGPATKGCILLRVAAIRKPCDRPERPSKRGRSAGRLSL
jgi:hypothetical protein